MPLFFIVTEKLMLLISLYCLYVHRQGSRVLSLCSVMVRLLLCSSLPNCMSLISVKEQRGWYGVKLVQFLFTQVKFAYKCAEIFVKWKKIIILIQRFCMDN